MENNLYCVDYINSILDNPNRDKSLYEYNPKNIMFKMKWTGYIPGVKAPPVDAFYLKSVIILSPDELMDSPLNCECGKELSQNGWAEPRYCHSLRSGIYVLQRKYLCNNRASCNIKSLLALKALQLPSVPDELRMFFPFSEKHNSMLDEDFMNYITSDTLTGY